ncbi:hypothetical protein [Haloferula sp.]|uniref:hypothetical protein n=1 Tax=Haloferula sp. TaxID=2497595 RepID=UPI003C753DBD
MKLAGFTLIALMSLNSCVGVGIVKGEKKEHSSFGVTKTKSKASRRIVAQEGGANPSREEIRSKWGAPDRQDLRDGGELWSYDSGLAVRGAIPMLGIGIPLIIPVGKNSYEFSFHAGSKEAA